MTTTPLADILIVDDIPDNLRLLAQILEHQYKVRLAPSGTIALQAIRAAPPDLILLDIMMPDLTGFEVAEQLKNNPETSDIPIIFISALDDTESKVNAFQAGGVDFITKPFQQQEVQARVKTHLSIRRLYQQAQDEIAERKRIEASLRESEEKYRTVANFTYDWEAWRDPNGKYLYISPSCQRISGYAMEEFINDPGLVLKITHHDDQHLVCDHMDSVLGHIVEENLQLSFRIIRPDGSICWIEHSCIAVYDSNGQYQGRRESNRDITARKKAEEAMLASNAKLETIVKVSPLAITMLDEQGKVLIWNSSAEKIFGWSSSEVLGQPNPIVPNDKHGEYAELQEKILGGMPIINIETVRLRKDGSKVDVSISSAPTTNPQGAVNGRMAIIADISERKRTEAALMRYNEEMAALYETSLEINTLADISDLLRTIVEKACTLLKLPSGALYLASPNDDSMALVVGHDIPQHWIGIKVQPGDGMVGRITQTKKSLVVEDYATWSGKLAVFGDSHAHRAMGVPLKIRDQVIGAIILMDTRPGSFSDEEIRLVSLFADQAAIAVTNAQSATQLGERLTDLNAINAISQTLVVERNLETLIHKVGEQIRALFNASVVYINLLDAKTRLIHFYYQYENGRFSHNTTLEFGQGMTSRVIELRQPILINSNWEVESKRCNVLRDPDVAPSRASLTVPLLVGDRAIGTISLQDLERENVYTQDHVRQLTTIAANLAVAVDNILLNTALQAELAERKHAEESVRTLNAELEKRVIERTAELESANRELENLSYNIAHDMRSPVRAMVGYAGMVKQNYQASLDEEGLRLLDNVLSSGQRLGDLIDDFLTFLHAGHVTTRLRPVNMDRLASEVVKHQLSRSDGRKLEFTLDPLPECVADPRLMEHVLQQLVANAVKFTRPCPVAHIHIGADNKAGKTVYFVRDNGVGFDMKYADKLFGVFQKLHHESEFEGTGIGLAITKRIILRHNGRVWVDSNVNQGTTFYFTLGAAGQPD